MGSICAAPARSDYTFPPGDPDLADLPSDTIFLWKITASGLTPQEVVTGAALCIYNIDNTAPSSSSALYIHLLDDTMINQAVDAHSGQRLAGTTDVYTIPGLYSLRTSDSFNDSYISAGVLLTTYSDTNGSWSYDLSYAFTPAQIGALNSYLANGAFGLGFDPDCYFSNNGVALTLHTQAGVVPAPGALLLASLGAALVH